MRRLMLFVDTVRPFKNETTILRLRSYFFLMLS